MPESPKMSTPIHLTASEAPMTFPIFLNSPRRVTPLSAWHEHIPFGMFLVDVLKPEVVVELGTQWGDSYCALCQAVEKLNLNARCFAVDTWKGDPQTGFYGTEVLENLKTHHDPLYGGFSKLIQSTFDEALPHFADGTITLLHIDGYHAYEAAKHDLESWLPKMNRRGVVLLHDTNVREGDFGVWRLWDELRRVYPHFEFVHGHGLGILGVGKDQPERLRELFESSDEEIARTRDFFFRLGHRLTFQVQSNAEKENLHQQVAEREQTIQALSSQFAQKEQAVQALSSQLNQKERAVQAQLNQKERAIQTLTSELAQKERAIQTLTSELAQKEQAAQGLEICLNQIRSSHGWRTLQHYYRLRDKLLPAGSLRRGIAECFRSPRNARRSIRLLRDARCVAASGLFDSDWYLQQNPDVAKAGVNPLVHYLRRGALEERDPNPLFDTDWYLQQNPDVAKAGVNPLAHYLRQGALEGRDPNPLFDSDWYLQQNPDVAKAGVNPLAHYLGRDALEERDPNPLFDTDWYLQQNPDVAKAGVNPLAHYLGQGALEGRDPNPFFDSDWYLQQNPEVAKASVNPLAHYLRVGAAEGRATNFHSGNGGPDWQDYEILARQISAIRQSRVERLSPKLPSMISVGDMDFSDYAKSLIFSTERQVEVSIVIPVFNNLRFTLECLTSIMKYSSGVSYEVIVVDDGSSDQTPEVLSHIPNVLYLRSEQNVGFVQTCNRGAEKARGEYVLLLNNDVQVTDGWLKHLVDTFKGHSNVGAVGPKLLNPNGRLQEAGALINRNGSSTMIGFFDDPILSRYDYIREVTYCSGACLLVKARVFRELGGFDTAFAPAYCEDCDLSFRLRDMGLRVMYNPQSVVIHHLSVTSNSIDDTFKLQSVIRNQQKLSEQWQREMDDLNQIKIIAFYLPQYHPIPENDRWWGKGFTEWTNVAKARPNFIGHYQPHLPADLGFYDLRAEESMEQQAELAKRYGIYGFCYFYFWFTGGKRLLELPLERLLETSKPNIPFCIAWANENWTRRWDGREHEVLIAQQHSEDDDRAAVRDMMRYMRHPYYIRINGKPLLIVYQVDLFPDIKRTAEVWRDLCRKEGLGEIYLALVESFGCAGNRKDPATCGFDASIEFPPHGAIAPIVPPGKILNLDYRGVVHDYRRVVLDYLQREVPGYVRFRSVMPSWDNTPRRQNDSFIFENASPGAYEAWLEAILEHTHEQNFGEERIVFINAWNEWGEGNHLEPDRRNGHGFLEATRNAQDMWLLKRANVDLG